MLAEHRVVPFRALRRIEVVEVSIDDDAHARLDDAVRARRREPRPHPGGSLVVGFSGFRRESGTTVRARQTVATGDLSRKDRMPQVESMVDDHDARTIRIGWLCRAL